jgi:hypothetical protein
MNRKEAFQEIARAGHALAELCDKQKDTVAWWTDFGTEFQRLGIAVESARPKDNLMRAAQTAMKKTRADAVS